MSFEKYKLSQGNIIIAHSDKNLSTGTMEINSNQEFSKHSRPVLESLLQLKGRCVIKLFENEKIVKEVILKEGDFLDITPHQIHIHSNPFPETSLTFWKANGDISEIIEAIRLNSKM